MEKIIDGYTSDILTRDFLKKYVNRKVNWKNGLAYIVYKRTYARQLENGQTEEYWQTLARCINGAQKIGAQYTQKEAERLYDYMFNFKCLYAGRMLWQLGTPIVDKLNGNSLINCFYTNISSIEDFCFLFENLMLGGGVGFSVRREHVHELPKIKPNVQIKHENTKDADFIVPDSRSGWISLLRKTLESYFVNGKSFTYSTILVRGYGEPIKTFGGTASGPKILIDGIDKICQIFKSRENKKLRSIDALDICNIIGSVVVAGNIRRSAQIALGDADDYLFLKAKRWDSGNIPNWRAMSNNTICADEFSYISDSVWEGYNGVGEPYGFFNLNLTQTQGRLGEKSQDTDIQGLNPCQPKWAKILTKNGIQQLKDVNIGEEIWSKDGWTKILNKWSTGIKKVYEYRTTAGCFYGTDNHKLVSHGEKIEANNAESIDIICGEYNSEVLLNIQDVMDGIVLGDGTVHKASNNLVHLCIGQDDYDYFHSEIKSLINKHRPGLHDCAYEIQTTITSNELPYTYLREVPDRFYYGNLNKKCGFLRGLFSANGGICGSRIALKASSFKIIEQVQAMLSSIGIRSYYTTNKPNKIKFSNGEYECRQSYDLNISVDRNKFQQIIGFIQEYKNERLLEIINKTGKSDKPMKRTYDIISTNLVSEEEVFDITVDNESHTYWTQGCNVSNCGEIGLENGGVCNLSEVFLNNIENKHELIDCAKLLYKTQKAVCALNYLHERTSKIVHKNRRIGLGVGGICQAFEKLDWLDDCYKELKHFDKEWSQKRNWPESIKLTTIKPSGTISLVANASAGVHPAYAKYYIRRVRIASDDKLVQVCKDCGYKTEFQINFDDSIDRNTLIIEFPCYAGENVKLAKDMSAIQQLELVKKTQTVWADNAVSCTVYYKKEELKDIKEWLSKNYDNCVKSVSFLLHKDDEHGFVQPPYEEISEEKYKELISLIKPFGHIQVNGDMLDGMSCAGGACPIR